MKLIIIILTLGGLLMNNWISPVDRARMGVNNDLQSRVSTTENALQAVRTGNVTAQNQAEISTDPWAINQSYPYAAQGRLTSVSGVPNPGNQLSPSTALYFTPYKGNLLALYDGSQWNTAPFQEFGISIQTTVSGTMVSGQPTITGLADTSQLIVGMQVTGTNLPPVVLPTIVSVDSTSQVTLSANATGSGTNNVTFLVPAFTTLDIFAIVTNGGQFAARMIAWNVPSSGAVTNITAATPPVVTSASHGLTTGDIITFKNLTGTISLSDGAPWSVTVLTANTFSLQGLDGANSVGSGTFTASSTTWIKQNQTTTRISALSLQDGIYVLASDPTWRYLGTVWLYNAGSVWQNTQWSGVWNNYNRLRRAFQATISAASWTPTAGGGWLPDDNRNYLGSRLQFVVGIANEEPVRAMKHVAATVAAGGQANIGISLDSIGAPIYSARHASAATGNIVTTIESGFNDYVSAGNHFLQGVELTVTNGSMSGNGLYVIEGDIWS